MITEAIAHQQISRLSALNFFAERGQPGIEELMKTLRDASRDESHARQIIDTCLSGHGCPEPADIRRIAHQLTETPWEPEPAGRCGCDHGFLHGEVERDAGAGKQRYLCAKPCPRCNPNWGGK